MFGNVPAANPSEKTAMRFIWKHVGWSLYLCIHSKLPCFQSSWHRCRLSSSFSQDTNRNNLLSSRCSYLFFLFYLETVLCVSSKWRLLGLLLKKTTLAIKCDSLVKNEYLPLFYSFREANVEQANVVLKFSIDVKTERCFWRKAYRGFKYQAAFWNVNMFKYCSIPMLI